LGAGKKAEQEAGGITSARVKARFARVPGGALIALLSISSVVVFFAAYLYMGGTLSGALMAHKEIGPPGTDEKGISSLIEGASGHLNAMRYAEAEGLLREALALDPENGPAYNSLGYAIKKQGRYKEAARAYEEAIRLDPSFYEAMNNLAVALEAQGKKYEAEGLYRKILSGEPANPGVHLNYALLLESENRFFEAESHYHTFLNLSRDTELKELVMGRLKYIRQHADTGH
jgi:Flp pilus assembly protein TadD